MSQPLFIESLSKNFLRICMLFTGSRPIWSLVSFLSFFAALTEELEACNHPVYCLGGPGTILHSVQLAHLFNDSKTFVDLPLLTTHQTALEDFKRLQDEKGPVLTPHQLKVFLEEHFDTSAHTGSKFHSAASQTVAGIQFESATYL